MGFEYKIKTNLTSRNNAEIQMLLEKKITFEGTYEFQGQLFWNFRKNKNKGEMPNVSILFEKDGIYILQYSSSYLWTELEELKHYLEKENITYHIIDHQK
ncbi:hypothetical protein MHTCC0001_31900 [Flavobacteriaceae bacterium MHTCC 0001]